MMHSNGDSTWAEILQGLMIWTDRGAVKISYQLDSPTLYFLQSYSLCPETCKNSREILALIIDAKFGGEKLFGLENNLVFSQN